MSDSVRPHRWQPTRLPCPWDAPGKNTAVGCHFFLQCMKVKSESEVAQSCLTLCDPMDCSLPASSVHGIFQARVLEWGASPYGCLHKIFLKINVLVHICVCVLSCVQLFVSIWTVACQALLSMEFFQARLPEWVAISFSRGPSQCRDQT